MPNPHAESPETREPADDNGDKELEAMKKRVKEMEAEAAKLHEMQAEAERESGEGDAQSSTGAEEKEVVDARSVFVGNVFVDRDNSTSFVHAHIFLRDYGSTPEEIQTHFQSCGTINRVTILCDKFTGHPKGFAYIEFAEPGLVQNALLLNDSLFRGRPIKVTAKRTNIPFMARGRGRSRGAYRGGMPMAARGYVPYPRGRGGYRGRGRGF